MSKITDEEKQGISNGVKLGIAGVSFLIMLSTLVWNGAFYVFKFEAAMVIIERQSQQIEYLQSQNQALNIKLDRKQDK